MRSALAPPEAITDFLPRAAKPLAGEDVRLRACPRRRTDGGEKLRGYFGVGVDGISKPMNLGNLVRIAHAFDASFFSPSRRA